MENQANPCACGSDEFITRPRAYDLYRIVDGRLAFIRQETVDEEFALYCRRCGEEQTGMSQAAGEK
jgi:hypothetical protein